MRATDKLEVWSIENWEKLRMELRAEIINHLFKMIPEKNLRELYEERLKYNSFIEIPFFHFGYGMAIRNTCRDIFLDGQLPKIKQPDGDYAQNWDDFYIGAVYDLVEKVTPPGPQA